MFDLRTADRVGSGSTETSWRTELFKNRLDKVLEEPFAVTDLAINGKDIMDILAIKPGPAIGTLLQEIFEKVSDEGLPNEREKLLAYIQEKKASTV